MDAVTLTGFVNTHSHAFQRALRGRVEGGDFWAWREMMLAEAERMATVGIRDIYTHTYNEMRAAGYTAVGEFHYLGANEAFVVADAAEKAGVTLVLLHVAYARGGIARFRQESVSDYIAQVDRLRASGLNIGVAPHSVRACPRDWLEEIGGYASAEQTPLHVHADEQPLEIDECLAEHGVRPIELLAATGCLGPRTTIIHATHASDSELDLIAAAGARICVCPTTEANLGDGFIPVERILARGIPISIGSDSNIRIDPLEELREIEGTARRQALRRSIISPAGLYEIGSTNGAASLGLENWPPIAIDRGHPSLRGVSEASLEAALLHGCSAEVIAAA